MFDSKMQNTGRALVLACILVSSLTLIGLSFHSAKATDGNPVHNINTGIDYSTIQAAVDAQETKNGNTITIDPGTYFENIVVTKSLSLVGADRNTTIVDGRGQMDAAIRVAADGVKIKDLTVRNATTGILVDQANDTVIIDNNAIENIDQGTGYREIEHGIRVRYSGNCTLEGNIVQDNANSGILITNSWNFTADSNFLYNNRLGYGLNANDSSYGVFKNNYMLSSNFDGIGLGSGSANCLIVGNTVKNSSFLGIWVDAGSVSNVVYHNNFFFNRTQAPTGTTVQWDNGIEGNYWIDYRGLDLNNDGIGDTPAFIDSNNSDNYPLMGPYSTFIPYKFYSVNVISNSAITDLTFSKSNSTLKMTIVNATATQTNGFIRIQVPHSLMLQPYNVTVDGGRPNYANYSIFDDGTSRWLYFTYSQTSSQAIIQGNAAPDVDAPIIDILSPENRLYQTNSVELNFTLDEKTPWIGYSLDGQANVTIQGAITLSGLSVNDHNITVYANDTAGNMGSSGTVIFTIASQQFPILYTLVIIIVVVVVGSICAIVYLRRRRASRLKS